MNSASLVETRAGERTLIDLEEREYQEIKENCVHNQGAMK